MQIRISALKVQNQNTLLYLSSMLFNNTVNFEDNIASMENELKCMERWRTLGGENRRMGPLFSL